MSYQSIYKDALFAGKNIVVTGGGSGIGRCIAHELARLGAHVIIIGRKLEKLEKVSQEIHEDGGKVSYFSCDIRDDELVEKTVKAIVNDFPQVDGLVNNAGGQFPAPLSAISKNGFETVLRTNLVGGFLMAKTLFNQSMSKYGGSIVNIIADMWNGMPGMGHSGAARAGMENFTKTAAIEWAPAGVRVNAVAPGWIASSGMDTYDGAAKAMIPTLKKAVPLQRMGEEAEVSSAVCFLLSQGASFITGATLCVDGAAPIAGRIWPMSEHNRSEPYNGFHRYAKPQALED